MDTHDEEEIIKPATRQSSHIDLQREARRHRRRPSNKSITNERTGLLDAAEGSGSLRRGYSYTSVPGTPRPRLSRHQSGTAATPRNGRAPSFTQRLTSALSSYDLKNRRDEPFLEDRVWYDQVHGFPGSDPRWEAVTDVLRSLHPQVRKTDDSEGDGILAYRE